MSRRIKTVSGNGRDYNAILKEYFGFHLCGLEIKDEGGQMQVQLVYLDFKHIDTVRRELAQMMPEVEFVKIRRDYTESTIAWALSQMMWESERHPSPTIYVQRGKTLVQTTIRDIATTELNQLELDEDDNIPYTDYEKCLPKEDRLQENAWD